MTCIECDKWKRHQEAMLMKCESIFDIHIEMCMFEEKCRTSCPFVETDKLDKNS